MTEDPPPTSDKPFSEPGKPPRRAFTFDESSGTQFRQRTSATRKFSPHHDGSAPTGLNRRRSSNFSEYSLKDARRSFQESTDDLLLPKPSGGVENHDSSPWHSAPLAFALLPALGGMLFKNGSAVITDVMLLGLAAVFLNWSVRLPWDWYHSAQTIRQSEEYNGEAMSFEDSEEDNPLSFSQATLEEVPEEEEEPAKPAPKPARKVAAHEAATKELYKHEILGLLSCFIFPVLGAYLLHTIRTQLTRPSEGLVSNYNLTIFLLASELRPMAHLVKLIQSRTLHLQRLVATNPHEKADEKMSGEVNELISRLEDLEARSGSAEAAPSEPTLNGKQTAILTTEIRRSIQPDLDALNRAVRRYENRATLQAFQTESRLQELESRLNDAISLAAAAANSNAKQRGFTGIVVEWAATAVVLPVQACGALARLPFKTMMTVVNYGKAMIFGQPPGRPRKATNGKSPATSSVRLGGPPRGFKK